MAIEQTEEIIIVEEIVDGKLQKIRRTIKRTIEEEIIKSEPELEPEPEPEPKQVVEEEPEPAVLDPEHKSSALVEVKSDSNPADAPASITSRLVCQCQSPSGFLSTGLAHENGDGTFTLDVNATEPGIHRVMIFLDGKAIPGSPFCVRILQSAVKEQVHMYGPGLESGIIANVDGTIHIDTTGAGPGELKVGVSGPTGGYTVTLTRDESQDRIVHVNYNPTLPGIYKVNVLWNNEPISDSPHEFFMSPNAAILHTWYEDPDKYKQIIGM